MYRKVFINNLRFLCILIWCILGAKFVTGQVGESPCLGYDKENPVITRAIAGEIKQLTASFMLSNTKTFFDHNIMKTCNLSYIDPLHLKSTGRGGKDFVWIALIGDSLLRSPFLFLSSQISGYEIGEDDREDDAYKLGPRVSRSERIAVKSSVSKESAEERHKNRFSEWSAANQMKLHLDHLICCSIYTDSSPSSSSSSSMNDTINSCTVGVKGHEYDDTASYTMDVIKNRFHGKAICITWHWAPLLQESIKVLQTLFPLHNATSASTSSASDKSTDSHSFAAQSDTVLYPSVIITNPGLHEVWNSGNLDGYNNTFSQVNMQKLFDMYDSIEKDVTYRQHPPLILVHKVMAMTNPRYNAVIETYNKILDQHQGRKKMKYGGGDDSNHRHDSNNSTNSDGDSISDSSGDGDGDRGSRVKIIETYPLSQMLHKMPFCSKGDGIHFTRQCLYNPLITQIDLNWMRYDGIIPQ